MSLEDDLLAQRVNRVQELEALGSRPYGQRFDFTHTIPEILAAESAKTAEELEASKPQVKLAGRIMTVRRMGKAGFMHLSQSGERLQVYIANILCINCSTWEILSAWRDICSAHAPAS